MGALGVAGLYEVAQHLCLSSSDLIIDQPPLFSMNPHQNFALSHPLPFNLPVREWYSYPMNHKQQRTLDAIMKEPASGNIHWRDIESMLKALGAKLESTHGARLHVTLNKAVSTLHRPHHSSVLSKQDVRHLRQFLISAGL